MNNKERACDIAYDLILLFETIEDWDFINEVVDCIKYKEEIRLGMLRDKAKKEADKE